MAAIKAKAKPPTSAAMNAPFRVIIVGAGVTGLVMAHILQRAGIDHVVLEAHESVVHPAGSSFGIWPNAARILDQIGCWEDAKKISDPVTHNDTLNPDGTISISTDMLSRVGANFGYDCLVLERQAYLQILYQRLPDKGRILTRTKVTDIVETDDGVRVRLQDGQWEHGDIVVGCDGVHSVVRTMMWENANRAVPGAITSSEKRALHSSFYCLVGVAPYIAGIRESASTSIQREGFCIQIVSQPGQVFFFVCIKSPTTITWPERRCFTDEATEREAAKIATVPIAAGVTFGEVWELRTRGYLCSLEEGVFDHWHFGRTVLVGDSAHKMSPLLAHGGNCGLESAAALANGLCRAIGLHPRHKPDKHDLQAVFNTYQASREPRVRAIYEAVYRMTRLHTSDGHLKRFLVRHVLPYIKEGSKAASAMIRGAVKIDFLPIPPHPRGLIGFDDEPIQEKEKDNDATIVELLRFISMYSTAFVLVSGAFLAIAFYIQSSVLRLSWPAGTSHTLTFTRAALEQFLNAISV